jgi:ABC-2 type transport system ATP-binding protein
VSPIDANWDESQPIYRQLRDRVVAMMLEGVLKEGEALPSVRQVASEYRLNPLTVLKAYQQLADEGLVEKRRGLGMFVAPGAGAALLKDERRGMAARARHHPAPGPVRRNPAQHGTRSRGRAAAALPHGAQDMTAIIEARGLTKRYRGGRTAVAGVDFTVEPGRIVGLIGRNGAGKTSVLKALLGLTPCEGTVRVLGRDPDRERDALMREVSFIADTAVLPRWLKVSQAFDYVQGVHPGFDRERAEAFLAATDVKPQMRVRQLSKGMVTQLHLALVLAIRARLLVLDEPTLGLDLLVRRRFYDTLLNDYMDEERTILVTTHQVEEIEHLLTDVLFIEQGRIVLDSSVENLGERYAQLIVRPEHAAAARALGPFSERSLLGRMVFLYEGAPRERLAELGDVGTPTIADLFVARMQVQEVAA